MLAWRGKQGCPKAKARIIGCIIIVEKSIIILPIKTCSRCCKVPNMPRMGANLAAGRAHSRPKGQTAAPSPCRTQVLAASVMISKPKWCRKDKRKGLERACRNTRECKFSMHNLSLEAVCAADRSKNRAVKRAGILPQGAGFTKDATQHRQAVGLCIERPYEKTGSLSVEICARIMNPGICSMGKVPQRTIERILSTQEGIPR